MQLGRVAILDLLATTDGLTARQVADHLGWTHARAGMSLLRAFRVQLVRRTRKGVYQLSDKGQQRLAWLEEMARE